MYNSVDIVLVDPEHVQATVKTRTQVREVKDYARANNIKYYRGVVASGRTYNEDGDCTQEWYENPDYVAPETVEPEPEIEPVAEAEETDIDDHLEEPSATELEPELEPEPEVDYKALYEQVAPELENAKTEIGKLTEQIDLMEKDADEDDAEFVKLQEEYDDLCDALHLIGKHMHD